MSSLDIARSSTDSAPSPRGLHGTSSSGRILFWQGASLWIGRGEGRTEWHDHHAHQLSVAFDGDFRFRTEEQGGWQVYRSALVLGHSKHQFEMDGTCMAHLFIEPETRAGRALVQRHGPAGLVELPEDDVAAARRLLQAAYEAHCEQSQMIAAASSALALLCGTNAEPAASLDPRLARALSHVRAHVRQPLALADAAAVANLSESRFRHLFMAETGSSFRAYLLWLRINVAIEAVSAGASWTEAAHEAGFADSAHLARTHKRMFGIEPSSVRRDFSR
jgi:AraC-like DNA-binding protein